MFPFTPPEFYKRDQNKLSEIDVKSDIWSLGCLMFVFFFKVNFDEK